jgi:hypothetical protein
MHYPSNSHEIPPEIENSVLQFVWNHKRSLIAKAIMNKKSHTSGVAIPDFKLHFSAIAIKMA